jgi:Mn2+/Fe2+ NRAMP family transporter
LVLLVYVVAAFSIDVPWGAVAVATLAPSISFDRDLLLTVVAIFGTTISPYLFFWQASQEAEESRLSHRRQLKKKSTTRANFFTRISIDTWIGMLFSNLIAFFIIVTAGATLHVHGITKVETAAQAAEALRPVAGELAFALFAAGIIGTGMLAIPILAGSVAYAVAEMFHIRGNLEMPAKRAIGFYAIVSAATLGGVALTAARIDPIAMLFWSAVINGVVALPIMIAIMLTISNRGRNKHARLSRLPLWLKALGWCASVMMALATGLLAWSYLSQSA